MTIGSNWPYIEDPEQDPITFKKGEKEPVWRPPSHYIAKPLRTVHDNFRNTARENAYIFAK